MSSQEYNAGSTFLSMAGERISDNHAHEFRVQDPDSLVAFYHYVQFKDDESGNKRRKLAPVLAMIDALPGTLHQKRVLLTGLFWIQEADVLENIADRLGIPENKIKEHVVQFVDPQTAEQSTIEQMYVALQNKFRGHRPNHIEQLLLAGWKNVEIEMLLDYSGDETSKVRKRLIASGKLAKTEPKAKKMTVASHKT